MLQPDCSALTDKPFARWIAECIKDSSPASASSLVNEMSVPVVESRLMEGDILVELLGVIEPVGRRISARAVRPP